MAIKRVVAIGFLLLWLGVALSGCSGFLTKGYVTNKDYQQGYTSWVTIPHSDCTRVSSTTTICNYWSTHIPVYHYPTFTLRLSSCYPPADTCDTGFVEVDGSTFDETPLGKYVDYSNR